VVTWGPETSTRIDTSRIELERPVPARVPLGTIFEAGRSIRNGLSRQAPLRNVTNGHGE
jgi:hypothetical protein